MSPPAFDSWTVQPVASRKTDCTIPSRIIVVVVVVIEVRQNSLLILSVATLYASVSLI